MILINKKDFIYFNKNKRNYLKQNTRTNKIHKFQKFYYTNRNNRLYYSNGGTPAYLECHSDYVISSLATTADSILIGYGTTSTGYGGGIGRSLLVDGKPTGVVGFDSNAKFQITTSYMVPVVLNASPEKTEKESSLYAAVTFAGSSYNFDNVGLWSYYPERGNWNRE